MADYGELHRFRNDLFAAAFICAPSLPETSAKLVNRLLVSETYRRRLWPMGSQRKLNYDYEKSDTKHAPAKPATGRAKGITCNPFWEEKLR
jgi:hypothetical protein